ncbi:hypothetical protein [Sporomusa malonica]|uniref:Uncharacterized protein n=1 Tax=Sporomusa malonica TaxID=112901 RepID=A0A1W2AUZ9_9FIRM|nr:hypothetical protein [Sporomusa malonica]SMC64360.1 hypothetical protein SAMN04488500_106134 [Sporomusa malonica]
MNPELTTLSIYEMITKIISTNRELPIEIKISDLTSYSLVSFYDFGSLRIKCGKKATYILLAEPYNFFLDDYPALITSQLKSEAPWTRILISSTNDIFNLQSLILEIYDKAFFLGVSEFFGCCSRYVQCSDNLKCVQPDTKLAKGCMYGRHLKKGKVFYGKNKNT